MSAFARNHFEHFAEEHAYASADWTWAFDAAVREVNEAEDYGEHTLEYQDRDGLRPALHGTLIATDKGPYEIMVTERDDGWLRCIARPWQPRRPMHVMVVR